MATKSGVSFRSFGINGILIFSILLSTVTGFKVKPENTVYISPDKGVDTVLKLAAGGSSHLPRVPGVIWSKIGRIFAYYSDDNGKTWKSSEEVANPDNVITQEPGVVEQKDGSLFMFIRTDAGVQYASYSRDKGETWSAAQPIRIASPLSPASIARIPASGDLLMVWNNNGTNQNRTPLNVAVSKDEGKTWEHIKLLEDDMDGRFCYTAIHFTGKYVLLAYSTRRVKKWHGTTLVRLGLQWIYR
jgi:sialidase-1